MKDLIEPTHADRETAARLVVMAELRELIRDGCLDDGPMVQAVAAHAVQARLEGIRLGLKAASKAIRVAQYDLAPYTTAKRAIEKLDPSTILRDKGE